MNVIVARQKFFLRGTLCPPIIFIFSYRQSTFQSRNLSPKIIFFLLKNLIKPPRIGCSALKIPLASGGWGLCP